jgi:hypothetical protein
MPARSITDEEISLIKAMIDRGMKNKDIQFFFNRPNRSVNSGRISGIRSGAYSNSAEIEKASDQALDEFLKKFEPTKVSAAVGVPYTADSSRFGSPIEPSTIRRMFKKDATGAWRFTPGESDRHECKESFGFKFADKWLRAVAALANNEGGYILFGVKDKSTGDGKSNKDSYRVEGLKSDEFENSDPADLSTRIRSVFDPTPRVEKSQVKLGGMTVGILYVHQQPSRPTIATKNEGNLIREGDIYFRYPGQSARIKYSDLRAILDARDAHARQQILPMVEKLLSLGPRDAMVADLANGNLSDDRRSILIGEDLLNRIKFIREGQFKEVDGEPTLKLVGEVQPIATPGQKVEKGFVTPSDLIHQFLDLSSPSDPKEYIRCAIEGGNGAWLPMHYYAQLAGLDRGQLSNFIMNTAAPPKRRKMYKDRATGVISAYKPVGGQGEKFARELTEGKLPKVETATDAADMGRAVASLESKPKASLKDTLSLLRRCTEIILQNDKQPWMSAIRRGLARLDELYFIEPPS